MAEKDYSSIVWLICKIILKIIYLSIVTYYGYFCKKYDFPDRILAKVYILVLYCLKTLHYYAIANFSLSRPVYPMIKDFE